MNFFRTEEVVHFGKDDADEIYYESIFKPVLFTARLYVALLTNNLMFRLVRAPSKRVFYIETGLDNQAGEAVNSFIRDVKSKETRYSDLAYGDITNMLAQISQFNDIYVPVVDGNKPIEIETITEDSQNFNDEFTEYLMKSMISGTGTPASFVNDSESVQFAKSLSMENAKYLRGCVRLQTSFGKQCSELLQHLYVNEFMLNIIDEIDKKEKQKDKPNQSKKNDNSDFEFYSKVIISAIKIVLPSPASLNTTNINDQISATQPIVDGILQAIFTEENAEQSLEYKIMKKKLYQHFVRNLDWEKIDAMMIEAKVEANKEKINNAKSEDESSNGGF